MSEVRLELKIFIYPEHGAWVAHCLEMDLPAGGKSPTDALKNLMDSVIAKTSDQLGNVNATVHLSDSKYPVGNPIKKIRHMATKVTSTVEAVMTPIKRLPNKLLASRVPPTQQPCEHCGSAADAANRKSISAFGKDQKPNSNHFSFNKQENKMSDHDQDLSGDDVKFVEYSILSIKRDAEDILMEGKLMVTEDMNGEAFTARMIKENASNPKVAAVSSSDLRVCFSVLARYARPEQQYDKDQADSLRQIADVVVKKFGTQEHWPDVETVEIRQTPISVVIDRVMEHQSGQLADEQLEATGFQIASDWTNAELLRKLFSF